MCKRPLKKILVEVLPGGSGGRESACQSRIQETQVRSLIWEDLLEKEMATHSNILALEIPWTEQPGWATAPGVERSWIQLSD